MPEENKDSQQQNNTTAEGRVSQNAAKENVSAQTGKKSTLKQIRTFQGDIAEALKREQSSMVSIQRAESRKQAAQPIHYVSPEEKARRRKLFSLILGTLILVILGSTGAWYTYNEFVRRTSPSESDTPVNRFITVNEEETIKLETISRDSIIRALASVSIDAGIRELHQVNLQPIYFTVDLLEALEVRAPGPLVRAFGPLFMLGVLGESRFIILGLESFESAFAGMLAWERDLAEDLGPLFSTRELLRSIPNASTPIFIDVTDRNKDIRELRVEGKTILLYSFFDNEKLVITDSLDTLRTVLDRLRREKLAR